MKRAITFFWDEEVYYRAIAEKKSLDEAELMRRVDDGYSEEPYRAIFQVIAAAMLYRDFMPVEAFELDHA